MMELGLKQLTEAQFEQISQLVKQLCGINLHEGKKELVKARLSKRLRTLGLGSFQEYIDMVRDDPTGPELTVMLDALSTNLTHFFREPQHFEYLREGVVPEAVKRNASTRRFRIWSAGCSSGEEPYTLGMVLSETPLLRGWDVRILGTDLSTKVLNIASEAVYDQSRFRDTPRPLMSKYFTCIKQMGATRTYKVCKDLREMVRLARLNLMENWPMRGPFDAIFCRNVMIYFDKTTQGRLVNRFWDILAPGGTLFIGHSESLTGIQHRFRYVQPTVYQRP